MGWSRLVQSMAIQVESRAWIAVPADNMHVNGPVDKKGMLHRASMGSYVNMSETLPTCWKVARVIMARLGPTPTEILSIKSP